jgi:kumamolisin
VKGIRCSAFGTSAVAPFWAALIARCNQALGRRLGHINPLLYQAAQSPQHPFRAIEEGDNNFYRAAAGWNACTGLGTPRGAVLLEALRSFTASG